MSTRIQTGVAAIKAVYEAALQAKAIGFVCLAKDYEAVLGDWFDGQFAVKLYDGSREVREIVLDTEENRSHGVKKPANCGVRYLDGSKSQTDVIITSDWAALVSFNPNQPEVTVFEDREVVKTFTVLFEMGWKQAKA